MSRPRSTLLDKTESDAAADVLLQDEIGAAFQPVLDTSALCDFTERDSP